MANLTRRQWLSLAAGVGILARPARSAPARPVNFVFFLIDDLGWADIGCFGSRYHETPNIDALCRRGMKFTNGYAAAPVCSPTRASIMTGKYPARLRMTDIIQGHPATPGHPLEPPEVEKALPLKEVTLAEALKSAGYVTASIGKWHLGAKGFYPEDQGFDVSVGGNHVGMTNDFFYPGWKDARAGGQRVLRRFGSADALTGVPLDGRPGEYLTDRLTNVAVQFIEDNKERPFFLYLSHYAVHIPIQAPKDLIAKYERKASRDNPQHNPVYAAMVEAVDRGVGKVTAKLRELGLDGRTVIFFMSDNGGLLTPQPPNNLPPTSNLPLREGKGHLYEGGIREPLIIVWPSAVRPGSVCDTPVISNDFYPTIVEIAGLRNDPGSPLDGLSLVPLLWQTGKLKRDTLYWHWPHYAIPGAAPGSAIRRGNFKLIEFFEDGRVELYNLAEDPGEKNDLAGAMAAKKDDLLNALRRWRQSLDAGMMRKRGQTHFPAFAGRAEICLTDRPPSATIFKSVLAVVGSAVAG